MWYPLFSITALKRCRTLNHEVLGHPGPLLFDDGLERIDVAGVGLVDNLLESTSQSVH